MTRGCLPRPRKALNSWMAFRTHYKRIFLSMQQKDASRYLTILWQRDPFKAKWAVIAAAYSKLRDELGKANVPLKEFLTVVCPEMGIMDSETYLRKMNWICKVRGDGTTTWQQAFDPILSTMEPNILYSTMTVDDIVKLCAQLGYISYTSLTFLSRFGMPSHLASSTSISRQGLLISRPTLPPQEMGNAVTQSNSTTSNRVTEVPFADTSGSEAGPLWTGSMSEVYCPAEGSAEFEELSMRIWQARRGNSLIHF